MKKNTNTTTNNTKEKKAAPRSSSRRKNEQRGLVAEGYEALTNGYESIVKSNISRTLQKNVSRNEVIWGLLAVGVAGAATYALIKGNSARHNGRRQSNHMAKTYNNIKDKAQEYAHDAYDYASDYADNIKECCNEMIEDPTSHPVLLGALGTILGTSALYLMNNKNAFANSEEILDKIKNIMGTLNNATNGKNAKGWVHAVKDVLETMNEGNGKRGRNSKFHNAVELGLEGLSFIETLMKKR